MLPCATRIGNNSRDSRHVVIKLGQESWERKGLVHADDVFQPLHCVCWESDASLSKNKTEGEGLQPGLTDALAEDLGLLPRPT